MGPLKNYGTVCYSDSTITNILSLAQVKKRYPITYDSKNDNQFLVIKPDKHVVFKERKSGLFYHDTMNRAFAMINANKDVMVDTVKANR